MGLDLRERLREQLLVHPRLVDQRLWTAPGDGSRLAAELPPLIPFGTGHAYFGCDWLLDWDHRIPSRHAVLRLFAYYSEERQRAAAEAMDARRADIAREDLFPEFDVPDFAGLPADEAYEAEMDIGSPPSRLRLVSEWRRHIEPTAAQRAIEIVRASQPFRELQSGSALRPPSLGDLEAAEWCPPCETGHSRWGIDVWYLMTFNGLMGEGRAFLVDSEEDRVVRERDFQFRAG